MVCGQVGRRSVDGNVFLRAGFTADGDGPDGAVRLVGAHIGGQLDCSGALVTSRSDHGINSCAQVHGCITWLDESEYRLAKVRLIMERLITEREQGKSLWCTVSRILTVVVRRSFHESLWDRAREANQDHRTHAVCQPVVGQGGAQADIRAGCHVGVGLTLPKKEGFTRARRVRALWSKSIFLSTLFLQREAIYHQGSPRLWTMIGRRRPCILVTDAVAAAGQRYSRHLPSQVSRQPSPDAAPATLPTSEPPREQPRYSP